MQENSIANYKLLASFVFAFLPFILMAQLRVDAEFRPRTELRHGYKTMFDAVDDAAFFTSQRTRLNFDYAGTQTKYYISIQDVRVWGDHFQLSALSHQIMLHQGWAQHSFNNKLSLKVGRQELNYDDARILGNVDWVQQARAHDLALFKYDGDFKIHLGAAFNQMGESLKNTFYPVTNYKTMQFVWFNKKFTNLGVSLLFLNNGFQHEDNSNLLAGTVRKTVFSQTFGGRATHAAGNLSLAAAAYYTVGNDAQARSLSAHYLSAEVNFKGCSL